AYRPDVKKELAITKAQMDKIPVAVLAAVAKILNEKQLRRLKEIDLQARLTLLTLEKDAAVQKQLNLTDEQKKNIAGVVADSANKRSELFPKGKGPAGGFKVLQEKYAAIDKDATEKIRNILDADQRQVWA